MSLSLQLAEVNSRRKDTKQEERNERRVLCMKVDHKGKKLMWKYLNIIMGKSVTAIHLNLLDTGGMGSKK